VLVKQRCTNICDCDCKK